MAETRVQISALPLVFRGNPLSRKFFIWKKELLLQLNFKNGFFMENKRLAFGLGLLLVGAILLSERIKIPGFELYTGVIGALVLFAGLYITLTSFPR